VAEGDKSSAVAREAYREASQRFEYFILGVSVALVAYGGKTLETEKLGINPYTLEVAALLLFTASVVVGFKRIEKIIIGHRLAVGFARVPASTRFYGAGLY
jgi:hypothetical protein